MGSAPKSTPEQRERWREKSRRAYLRRQAREKGLPDPFPDPVVVAQPSAGAVPAAAGDPPPVPWDPSILAPLFRSLVPAFEQMDIASLKAKASPAGQDLIRMVEQEGRWNPVAKTTLEQTGPAVTSQLLDSLGVSPAHAPMLAMLGAIGSIVTGRVILASKIDEMIKALPKPPPST